MAREYAPIRLDIWTDDDWRSLTRDAQWLYFYLLTSPTLSYCGVADWRPGRIAAAADDLTADTVRMAAAELIDRLFIVADEDSEEVLVRSFIKHDGLLRNPKTSVSMANAFAAVASKTIRGVIIHQLVRLHSAAPDLKAWTVEKVTALLLRDSIDPVDLRVELPQDYPQDLPVDLPQGLGNGLGEDLPQGLGETYPEDLGEGSLPAPAPAPYSSSISGGYVSGERNDGDELAPSNDPPPSTCPRHPDGTDRPCGACADARKARERWEAELVQAEKRAKASQARATAAQRRAEIDDCELCDDSGYTNGRVCSHDPDAVERNRRGAAMARAELERALAKRGGDD
ncbi:hypothetical protein [Gordonia sp. OPL2]|uniref:hypothetical protein n=1 Tax=Gordonia sp. OPL2 TaxID=2486274 RepID=UPI001655F4E8|nr:hypothetical protein [Gordonia sp. OPL2]ROZ88993.1 hypothetical protein EEB19_19990 [Gordonia sp. OPL2]